MGVWSAIAAARQNRTVCLVEKYAEGHARGSSHGDGRIYRFAYADEIYVDMMYLSLSYWGELNNATSKVLAHTGGVSLYSGQGGNYDSHGGLDDLIKIYKKRGLAHEKLSRKKLKERFPQFSAPKNTTALYQPDFGVLFADVAMARAYELARKLKVDVREGSDVVSVKRMNDRVVVRLKKEEIVGRSCIVAPGAWLTLTAKKWFGLHIPTTVTRETVSYFKPKGSKAVYGYKRMPVFISDLNNGLGDLGYYGIPVVEIGGVKVAAHHVGAVLDDKALRTHNGEGDPAIISSNERFVASFFPGLEAAPFHSESCLYTTTPDYHYVLDKVPGAGAPVILAGGGSGHAFKMGPAIGDAAAALALGVKPPFSLETFRLDRPALR